MVKHPCFQASLGWVSNSLLNLNQGTLSILDHHIKPTIHLSFPICELLGTVRARERFPLAEPTPPPEKVSVRERLNAAIQEAHRQASGHSRDCGGEGR